MFLIIPLYVLIALFNSADSVNSCKTLSVCFKLYCSYIYGDFYEIKFIIIVSHRILLLIFFLKFIVWDPYYSVYVNSKYNRRRIVGKFRTADLLVSILRPLYHLLRRRNEKIKWIIKTNDFMSISINLGLKLFILVQWGTL